MRRSLWLVAALLGFTTACGAALAVLDGEAGAAFANIALISMGYLAAAAGLRAGLRADGRARIAWVLAGLGSGMWASGNVIWAYNEHVLHAEVLFPATSDFGYLGFPILVSIALWLMPGPTYIGSKISAVLDGLIVTGATFAILWITTLGPAVAAGADTQFAFAVSLAYPLGDLVTVTMVFLLLTRALPGSRFTFTLLGTGLLGFAFADVMFSLYVAKGTYIGGGIIDLGWIAGFAALALAAHEAARHPISVEKTDRIPGWQLGLPYVPFFVALMLTGWHWSQGGAFELLQIGVLVAVFGLVMIRQLVTLTHNSALTVQLRHQAFHDPLTGLGNRNRFNDTLTRAIALHERGDRDFAVMLLDLDDFKLINDTYGHDAGDAVLQAVADRLRASVRNVDTVARLGGDEFAVLLEHGGQYHRVAERVLESLSTPLVYGKHELTLAGSVGVTVHDRNCQPGTHANEESVLKEVDLALYAAKDKGKGCYTVFSAAMGETFDTEVSLRTDLADAIVTGQLRAAYQPIVDVQTGRLLGLEALARWEHPILGNVPPDQFIAVAERAGLIGDLGLHMLDRACSEFTAWAAPETTYLSVNASPLELSEPTYPDRVQAILGKHGLDVSRLVLEITENALVDDDAAGCLHRLRELGVRLAVDDFGHGYASLRSLQRLPVDILKVDRSYVSACGDTAQGRQLIQVILSIARTLGLDTVAEGIEENAELQHLRAGGCQAGQGYLLSRPLEADKVSDYLLTSPPASVPTTQ